MSNVGDTGALAAEFVLGTLDLHEREQARELCSSDEAFAAQVRFWERRLGELHLMVEPVEPDPGLWERIKAKLPVPEPHPQLEAMNVDPAELNATEDRGAEAVAPAEHGDAEEVVPAEQVDAADTVASALAAGAGPEPEATPEPHAGLEPDVPNAVDVPSPTIVPLPHSETPPAVGAKPVDLDERPVPPPPEAPVQRTLVEPALGPVTAPSPARAVVPMPREAQAWPAARENAALRRRLAGWRLLALLMTLLVLAAAGLLAAWRWAPDRVPPALQPAELMGLVGVEVPAPESRPRPATPAESEYEE